MTTFQIWNGLNTIGGNIVEIRTEKARVICDFGLTGIGKVIGNTDGLSEMEYLIEHGFMPAIPELYDTAAFQTVKLTSFEDSTLETAIFISHLHLDHMGLLKYLPAITKVYLSEETDKLYRTLVAVGEEDESRVERIIFRDDEKIQIGDIQVQPKLTDHDTIGACAFFIEAPDLKLIHSGDVRLTGYYPERVEKWVQEAANWQPDVLLLEGTTFSFEKPNESGFESETALVENWKKLLRSITDQIIFYNPYIRNVDRLRKISLATKECGRTLVFEAAYAQLMHGFYPNETWTVLKESAASSHGESYTNWVSLTELQQHPEQYVLQNSFKNIEAVSRFEKGIYVHSNGEPLGDYDSNYAVLLDRLAAHQFEFLAFGASGHAAQEDLIRIAKKVQAKQTIPWHTFEPEKMHQRFIEEGVPTLLAEKGKIYSATEMRHN
ncbi:MBL fold metallo-hydrolase [Desemzia sp. RIT804]|uniref:MBL fold metallo-hydrolase n=1 Tax=Desemzia sp. RIT 804 TaxID=2810209 RepID=UPI00194FEDEC|nr:MBL fold metallo-hydrolase [Desemzia sp. RIT 804]MBM6615989.1 MBL fold metallo-hydrolase [Desemzia sp. RIT 804]